MPCSIGNDEHSTTPQGLGNDLRNAAAEELCDVSLGDGKAQKAALSQALDIASYCIGKVQSGVIHLCVGTVQRHRALEKRGVQLLSIGEAWRVHVKRGIGLVKPGIAE